jgi:hypothetical protein
MTSNLEPDFASFIEIGNLPIVDGRKVVPSAVLQRNPFAIQNAFVSLICSDCAAQLPNLRFAHLAFRYDGEVQNGGHLQFFTNLLTSEGAGIVEGRTQETVLALRQIKADLQAEILSLASERWLSQAREAPQDVTEYCEEALKAEFEDCDNRYYDCNPTTMERLEARLLDDEALFITRVP